MRFNGLTESFNCAFEGLIHTFRTQRNMKIHFVIAFTILLVSLFFDVTRIELIILFFSICFVIAMELVNTAVEVVTDMISKEYRYRAKIAKNVAAAAVLMAAVNSVVVGYFIFLDEIRSWSFNFINHIQGNPTHIIFIDLGLIIIIIIALKASRGRGTPLEGGMPSGHSAVSFAIATTVIVLTMNIVISTLVVLLALLVVQSRLQSRTHSFLEVFAGALIGIVITLTLLLFIY
ncbi:MAG: diacylglycerol kinase [Halanaerobiales bacterium]